MPIRLLLNTGILANLHRTPLYSVGSTSPPSSQPMTITGLLRSSKRPTGGNGSIPVSVKGDRPPFEWSKVGDDSPNQPVIDLVKELSETQRIIFVSGREEVCRKETLSWLLKHEIPVTPSFLYMRKEGDFRKDSIVKAEIFEKFRKDYYINFVLDDRNQTVSMWRNLGLTCLQVAEGDF